MPDTTTVKDLIVNYKAGQVFDQSVVYAPYVPLQFTSVSTSYWHATELHMDDHPLVLIDGNYLAAQSPMVRKVVEEWIAAHTLQGFYWEENKGASFGVPQIDIVRFLNIEDAMLFKIAFSARQSFG